MRRRLALAVAGLALLGGCSLGGCSATRDAVAVGGEFQFVAPGGRTTIFYDPPESRGAVRGLAGESLLRPGGTVGLEDHAGKVVVLNVWGSWCGPCRTEAPDLEFVHRLDPAAVAVLGLDLRDDRAAATDFVRDRGLTYDSIYDFPGRALARLGGVPRNVVPLTVVLDRQHRVAAVYLLPIRVPELVPLVRRLAAEPG